MSNYSDQDRMVRVDFFKTSGKWYMTEAVDMGDFYYESCTVEALKKSLVKHMPDGRGSEFMAVCLEPYHQFSHPVIARDWMSSNG